jgi:hypothetical protein
MRLDPGWGVLPVAAEIQVGFVSESTTSRDSDRNNLDCQSAGMEARMSPLNLEPWFKALILICLLAPPPLPNPPGLPMGGIGKIFSPYCLNFWLLVCDRHADAVLCQWRQSVDIRRSFRSPHASELESPNPWECAILVS